MRRVLHGKQISAEFIEGKRFDAFECISAVRAGCALPAARVQFLRNE
jgi:hypothetical protein